MRLLVTGAAGLIGTNIIKHYYKDNDIMAVDNLERSTLLGHGSASLGKQLYNVNYLKKLGVEVHNLDISKPNHWIEINKYGNFDAIFHMAAFCGVGASYKYPRRATEINAMGTLYALECARQWGSKVVYPSTFKVYGADPAWIRDPEGLWRWQNDIWNQHGYPVGVFGDAAKSPYGAAKYAGELLCQEYAKSYGVKVGVFRMSNIYGEHQLSFEEQGWLTWFIVSNVRGYPANIFGDGCQVRDLLYVTDLVEAYDSYIKSDIDFSIWNIGGGPDFILSLNQGINAIEEINEKLFSYLVYDEWRKSDLRVYTSDIRAVSQDLSWKPTIKPTNGIKKVLQWVKKTEEIW